MTVLNKTVIEIENRPILAVFRPQKQVFYCVRKIAKSTLFEKKDLSPFFDLIPLTDILKKNKQIKGEHSSCNYP